LLKEEEGTVKEPLFGGDCMAAARELEGIPTAPALADIAAANAAEEERGLP